MILLRSAGVHRQQYNKYMEALEATDPTSAFVLDHEKLQLLSTLGKIKLNDAKIAVAKQQVQRMQNATTLSVLKDPVIGTALPTVRNVMRLALTFGASSASCESSFSTISRVPTDYRHSVLHERLSALVLLAFEKDITDKVCKDNDRLLRMFDSMAVRRLPLF